MTSDTPVQRVAVVGAHGIGKHHAKWWALEGADVCALVGTSDASVIETRGVLEGLFDFQGRTYTDLGEMLREETPDIVDVCTPAAEHYPCVKTALEHGRHVLCEKPFVYDRDMSPALLLNRAASLVALAEERHLRLGVCTQYSTGARMFQRIWKEVRGDEALTHFHGHLESPARGRQEIPAWIWADLAPHVISVLIDVTPGAEMDRDSLRISFEDHEARAEFDAIHPDGHVTQCDLITRRSVEPPKNVRHFKFNGYGFTVEGEKDADGVYCARIETPDGNYIEPDMMRLVLRDFLAGTPTADGRASLANLRLMLRVLEIAGDKEDSQETNPGQ